MADEFDNNPDEDEESEVTQIVEKSDEEKQALQKIQDELHEYLDIPLNLNAELGRAKTSIREILKLQDGNVIEL